jgi:superfamily II DNA or RNA helicase
VIAGAQALTAPPAPILRPHQSAAVAAVLEDLRVHRSTVIVHPTGSGKSVTAAALIERWHAEGLRTLVICPAHLVDQFAAHAARIVGDFGVTIEQGSRTACDTSAVVVASVPTLKGKRLTRYKPDAFDRVVIDEAHHARAASWLAAVEQFPGARIVGLTATPDRADGKSLVPSIFETCSHQYTIREAIRDGYLVPIRYTAVTLDGVDLSRVRKTAGDYSAGSLGRAMLSADAATETIVERSAALVGNRNTVVFAVTIEHAEVLAQAYRDAGHTAIAVSSQTTTDARAEAEAAFEHGTIQYLVNVGCYCEGWDHPPVSAVVLARPTQSRSLYTQQIGRGLRLSPETGKTDCVIVDFAGGHQRHSLIHAYDVLIPGLSVDLAEVLEELAEDQLELSESQIEVAIEEADRRAEARQREIDILAARYPTADQLEELADLGVEPTRAAQLDRDSAQAVIGLLRARRADGLASIKQARRLAIAGTHPVDALALSYARATQGIRTLADHGWRRPPSWGPRQHAPSEAAVSRVPRVVRDLLVPLIAAQP